MLATSSTTARRGRYHDVPWSTTSPDEPPAGGSGSGQEQSATSSKSGAQVITGVFRVSVPDADAFVQSPYAHSMSAASVARLAHVSVDQVVVELLSVGGRRLRAATSPSNVDIDYIIRAAHGVAQPVAESLRSTTHAAASLVFSEEVARFAGASAQPSFAIQVIKITARSPQPAPETPDPALQAQKEKSSGLEGSIALVVIGSIMGAFCMIQIIPCLCDRLYPYRLASVRLFRRRQEIQAALNETPRSVFTI